MEHPYFGSLPDASYGLRWEGRVDLAGCVVSLDMTSDGPVTRAQLDAASAFPSGLPRFDAAARAALVLDFGKQEAVRLFMDHHFSVLPMATLESLFGATRASSITPEHLISRLVLTRVGLYPADDVHTAVFDYALDGDVTNYLLVVYFTARGEFASVEMES